MAKSNISITTTAEVEVEIELGNTIKDIIS